MRNKLKAPLALREILKKALEEPVPNPFDRSGSRERYQAPPDSQDPKVAALAARWEETTSPALAAKSRPVKIVGKKLLIAVASSSWANELEFMKPAILEKIQALPAGESLEEIRFQIETLSSGKMGLKTKPLKSLG